MTSIQNATEATFSRLVLENERPVVVDFWASWCGPCRMVAPELERLAGKYDGQVDVVKVDVDANPGLASRYGIMSIPTVALFRSGATTNAVVGFRPLAELEMAFGLADLAA